MLMGAYLEALSGLPLESVIAAKQRWNRAELYPSDPGRHGFMPKPPELVTLAMPSRLALAQATFRARLAMERVEEDAKPKMTDADRAEMREQLLSLGRSLTTGAPPPSLAIGRTPQQAAARLRAQADQRERPAPEIDDGECV